MDSRFTSKLLNGAIAGSVGTCCIFPLDLAKTRLQDQRTASKAGTREAQRLYKNVFHCIYKVARVEGFRGLYKGLGVNLLLVNPEKALKLAVNDQTRAYFGADKAFLPLQYEMLSGAAAGFCQVIVTTPMEFLKIQMQVSGRNEGLIKGPLTGESNNPIASGNAQSKVSVRGYGTASMATVSRKPIGASDVALNLIKQKGIVGIYKGLGATVARDVPFSCVYFPTFQFFNHKGYGPNGEKPKPLHSLASGCLAGMIAAVSVNPLDVIKTRLQVLHRVEGEPTYNGFIDCIVKTYKQEGIPAFFKGAVPRIIVIAPLFGIAQMVYFFKVAEHLRDNMPWSQKRLGILP